MQQTKFAVWTPSEADIGCFYIVMDKGLGSAARSAFCRQPRRHVPLLFGLPSHLPRASALARVEERGDDSSLLSRLARIRVFPMQRQRVSKCLRGKPYAVSRLLCKRVDASTTCQRERSILRFDKSAARMRAGRVEKQLQPASRHYFMVSYVHTSHTTSERASELRDPATWLARMLSVVNSLTSPLERMAGQQVNQIRISPAPAALTSQKSSSRSSHMLAIRAQIADARPKLTARNDPRKSQVIHSALPRPMVGRTVSVRTADLAGRPCRLRDAFTEIALANGERCFEALVSGCRVELRVKWP